MTIFLTVLWFVLGIIGVHLGESVSPVKTTATVWAVLFGPLTLGVAIIYTIQDE